MEQIEEFTKTLWVKIPKDSSVELNDITGITSRYKGNSKVIVYMEATKQKFSANAENYVNISDELMGELKKLVGEGNVLSK